MNNVKQFFTSRILLLAFSIVCTFAAKISQAQVITTLPLANVNLCACDQIIVGYSATGVYTAGNVFSVQLSNNVGNFVGAVTIGTLNSVALGGNIVCTIPCNTPFGSGYRIRIISSQPVAGGPNNGVDITIKPSPTVSIVFSTFNCVDTLTAIGAGGAGGAVPGNKYYITDIAPWGSPSNVNEMDQVFGVGNWIQDNFSANAAAIFVPGTQFVFIEGSDANGTACTNFMNANVALIESWVNAGGKLFLNAAPNNGGIQNWGFGGTTLNYQNLIPTNPNNVPGAIMTNLLHPINVGPNLPVDATGVYTGPYFAHADIVNGGTTVIHDAANPNIAVLTEKAWGAGIVMFGGMTTSNWHNNVAPLTNQHAINMRKNILVYLSGLVAAPPTYTYLWSTGATTAQILPTATGVYTVTCTSNLGCTATATYNYVAPPTPVVNITSTGVLCSGNTVTLDAGPGFATYLWDDASTGQTRVVNAAGTYYVTVTNAQGCIGSDTIDVVADTSLKADFTVDLHLGCENDTIFLTNNSTGAVTYNWLFGDGGYSSFQNPVPYVYFNQGIYTIRLIANNPPCADTMYVTIDCNHPLTSAFDITNNTPPPNVVLDSICLGYVFSTSLISPPVTQPTWVHEWNWGDGSPITGNNPNQHLYTTPGTFILTHTVTDTLGCVDSTQKLLFVDYNPYADFVVSDSVICVGEKVSFYDTLSPNIINFSWDFKDGNVLNNVSNPTHTWESGGLYNVTLTAKSTFCPDKVVSQDIQVNSYPQINIGRDTSICPGLTGSILIADVNNPGALYDWSTGESSNSIVVSQAGTYWARSKGECSVSDTIEVVRDCYLNIPNAFSPDGDGLNDYFIPREILSSGLKTFKMDIYNRWGENIFTTTSIDGRGWDGKYNGVPQPMSTYVYIIDAEFNNNIKKNFKGNVILVR
ncbi:MAG: gliding motility-associated C-terminal domain-containing protein [Bacteroidetes bacterium]|nr:gliding motility-associated C-terminal domain-containing protein [Bacteroidota bacterium]